MKNIPWGAIAAIVVIALMVISPIFGYLQEKEAQGAERRLPCVTVSGGATEDEQIFFEERFAKSRLGFCIQPESSIVVIISAPEIERRDGKQTAFIRFGIEEANGNTTTQSVLVESTAAMPVATLRNHAINDALKRIAEILRTIRTPSHQPMRGRFSF